MLVGAQAIVQFNVMNAGGAPSGPLTLSVPAVPWLSVASLNPLPSLAPGQSNPVTLVLTPAANLALGPYTGDLAVNSAGAGVQIPFTFNAVSDAHGALLIQSVDELTFFAAGAPPLTNATVTLTDPFSGSVVASGVTDSNGLFLASNLMAGTYALAMTANQHSSFNGSAVVTAGQTNNIQAFLSLQTVTYTWTVVPTQIQNETAISIQATFQTDVPAPVVVHTPNSIDLSALQEAGDFMDVPITLANYGLIAAQGVTIALGAHAYYEFDIITTNIGTLAANATVTIPLRITRLVTPEVRARAASPLDLDEYACDFAVGISYFFQCGLYNLAKGDSIAVYNAFGACGPSRVGTTTTVSGGAVDGGVAGVGGCEGCGGTSVTQPSTSFPNSCDPCVVKQLEVLQGCMIDYITIPIPIPAAISCRSEAHDCIKGVQSEGLNVRTAVDCLGAVLTCNEHDNIIVSYILSFVKCTYNLATACAPSASQSALASAPRHRRAIQSPKTAYIKNEGSPAFDQLIEAGNSLQTLIAPAEYFFGSSDWLAVTDTNSLDALLSALDNDIQINSDGGLFITPEERANVLALGLPEPLTAPDVNAFVDRWNLTISNYSIGIFTIAEIPAGADTNFIAWDEWTNLNAIALTTWEGLESQGYHDLFDPWIGAQTAIVSSLQGGSSGTCAQITLQIDQTAILTENAFQATLQVNNQGSGALGSVLVHLNVQNEAGQDVTTLFGIRSPTVSGGLTAVDGTGSLPPNASGTAQWTLIPSIDAAPQAATNYVVNGSISYIENGYAVSIPLGSQSITVQPSPQLHLRYFLQRDVYGDDPFTPQIEPSVPFPLAVMVRNSGYGTADNFQITSAQPTIIDNQKGLLISFNIIGTAVAGQPVSPSLTANFGNLLPGTVEIAEWWFTSSLDGFFTDYSATFQNVDALGNPLLSPIQGVEIHEIAHMVQADGSWDDGQPDFLVIDTNSVNSLPNMLYLSDWTVQPVSVVQTATTRGPVTSGNLQVQFTANFPAGFTYVLVSDPANGQFPLQAVLYANGVNFLTNNFWITDRTFAAIAQPPILQTNLHLFVYHTNAGPDTFTLIYGAPTASPQTNPPLSAVFALPAQSPPAFGVVWSGEPYVGGAPIAYYDVYVSDNGGPFTLWQSQTSGTGAIYNGTQGHTYAFYSIATDTASNRESTPLQPQAQTTVIVNTSAPTISIVPSVTLNAGQTLSLNVTARDPNPQNTLTFSLGPGAPVGVVVNPASGQITWATSPAFGGTTNLISVIATDNGQPPLSATGTVTVVLHQVASPPVLAPIANYTDYEATLLIITNSATDNSLPPKPLTFALGGDAPTNATVDPVTGIFQWRPTAAQAPSTNIISVIVADNGTPPLSATQQFTVVVYPVAYEFLVSFGSTNLLVGGTSSVPVVLTTQLPLTNITVVLDTPTNSLTDLAMVAVSREVIATLLQPLGASQYGISLTLNPALTPGDTRTLAQLAFASVPQDHSAIVLLRVLEPSGLQADGQAAAKPAAANGRVIIVGKEPVMDASPGTNASLMLTLYGNPGASYEVDYKASLLGADWQYGWRAPMTNLYEAFAVNASLPQIFYRAFEFSASPHILELNSAAPSNLVFLLYGQKGSNYMIISATNLLNTTTWTSAAGFTLTNSFQFINAGAATNQIQFFRAKRP